MKNREERALLHITAEQMRQRLYNRRLFSAPSLFRHVCASIRGGALYAHWQTWLTYFRRFRLIALLLRIGTWLLTILETGALVLLSSLLLLFLLPVFIFLMLVLLLTALFDAPRQNRAIASLSAGKCVYVLFLPETESAFFAANARDLATRQNSVVIIVSPFWISSRGIRSNAFYCTARKEATNVILVRRYYYFSLKKHVLKHRTTAYLY